MTDQPKPASREWDRSDSTWQKSTFSGSNDECVEMAHAVNHVAVRDPKNPEGSMLTFTNAEWNAFLAGAKRGEFDLA